MADNLVSGPVFPYGERETAYLKKRDPVLGAAIDRIGIIARPVIPDLFTALMHSIVGQQISTKAHITVWGRVSAALPRMTPDAVATLPEDALQALGLSFRKVRYIKSAAAAVLEGRLTLPALQTLPDDEVCRVLSGLDGVGVWTAEMLMTFSMCRPDVVSYGDLAIRRGMRMLYRHRELTPRLFQKYRRRYSPCGSVASLYLWAVSAGALPELTDPGRASAKPQKRSGV